MGDDQMKLPYPEENEDNKDSTDKQVDPKPNIETPSVDEVLARPEYFGAHAGVAEAISKAVEKIQRTQDNPDSIFFTGNEIFDAIISMQKRGELYNAPITKEPYELNFKKFRFLEEVEKNENPMLSKYKVLPRELYEYRTALKNEREKEKAYWDRINKKNEVPVEDVGLYMLMKELLNNFGIKKYSEKITDVNYNTTQIYENVLISMFCVHLGLDASKERWVARSYIKKAIEKNILNGEVDKKNQDILYEINYNLQIPKEFSDTDRLTQEIDKTVKEIKSKSKSDKSIYSSKEEPQDKLPGF